MKQETKDFIKDVKETKMIDELYEKNIIPFESFFKYSGKTEEQTKRFWQGQTGYSGFFDKPDDYVPLPTPKQLQIHNDMSKYKLKKNKI
tara:strand:- start:8467 stop:8733 length:267 start_codon:yes stop_codon:yes gene_type:complete